VLLAPVRVPSSHLPRMSRQSCLSANDKVDNEMIPGVVHKFPGISITAEENTGKTQLGHRRGSLCDQSSPQMGFLTSKRG